MFTVKHVQNAGVGQPIENLYEGDRITVHPDQGNLGALEIRMGEDTVVAALWGGVAYVMNSHGKTVAVHHLPHQGIGDNFNRKTASRAGEGATAASVVG
ncbi:MAG: hypothetical protein E5X35_11550 [Mesorhizobium sp.]|uniref:hypothetical protein n=1 Tax=unclassified Mesorhizobium TaxID=325217 RepID=UPI000FCC84B1|nr:MULTISPECIES: hypothetical protein [unclassified Mesorhizobium]RUV65215.1 hypothetical protein EOA85_00190 [Mesorhizobium sp. M5C.F.Ca.IN.020.29.1.1]TIM87655.1 MAG: hypothetical protein E5Y50_11520 [Mesorhizobium sp.]TIR33294.1 MAG: hypothetical protein E5X35_11550 [Mesorhizobium sp.]